VRYLDVDRLTIMPKLSVPILGSIDKLLASPVRRRR
jgi:hypothetical protein